MAIDMKGPNKGKGKPKSLPGTPAGKNKGNFQKKSLSPNKGGGGTPNKGGPGGKPFIKKDSPGGGGGKKFGNQGKPNNQQGNKQSSPSPQKQKPQQNGSAKKEFLKQLDQKSKAIVKNEKKPFNKKNKPQKNGPAANKPQGKVGGKRNKNVNRYQRFQEKLNLRVRTPQACERALKAEQELTTTQGRVLKITLPDQVVSSEQVNGWSESIESVLFNKPLQPRHFIVVLKAGANVKKEIEKLSKATVGNQKIIVKEQDSADLGHTGGNVKDPAELVDPYTLYVTNLADTITKNELQEFFKGSTASNPKKHNPKLGNPSKFAFVSFETPEEALNALKQNFNKKISDKSVVMRFRRLNNSDLRNAEKRKQQESKQNQVTKQEKVAPPAKAAVTAKAGKAAQEAKKQDTKKQNPKQLKVLKQEPAEDDDDDDDEDDDDDMELDQDDDEDDSEDGEGEEMDDDDEDDDDDDDEDDDEDDDDDDDDED